MTLTLKVSQACLEDLDYKAARGLDKRQIASLASCEWVRRGQNVLITGPTGSRKTWLACAPAQHACREGLSARYWRVPRLFEKLRVAHGDGSYMRLLKRIEKASILVLDDWGFTALGSQDRADLLEILDDRVHARSTILISQLPVDTWHAYLGEPTLADAILHRLVHHSHRIPLAMQGDSIASRRDHDRGYGKELLPPAAADSLVGRSCQKPKPGTRVALTDREHLT